MNKKIKSVLFATSLLNISLAFGSISQDCLDSSKHLKIKHSADRIEELLRMNTINIDEEGNLELNFSILEELESRGVLEEAEHSNSMDCQGGGWGK